MPIEDLTPAEKFIWKWRNRQLGDFGNTLINAMLQADIQNLENLRLGFPDEVEGFTSYRLIPGWWDELEKKMAVEPDEHLCKSCALSHLECIETGASYAKITECGQFSPKGGTA